MNVLKGKYNAIEALGLDFGIKRRRSKEKQDAGNNF